MAPPNYLYTLKYYTLKYTNNQDFNKPKLFFHVDKYTVVFSIQRLFAFRYSSGHIHVK